MKRKDFLKKSMALSAIGVTIPSILKAKNLLPLLHIIK